VAVEGERVILTRSRTAVPKVKFATDRGLPVLSADTSAPVLTGAQVAEILADFP
jgi:ABC-type sugar transport system substrate-binding protein